MEKSLSELVGLVRGVVADGVVSAEEADRLARWTRENPEVSGRWPANLLARRLVQVYRDGRADRRERQHLKDLLDQLAENSGSGGLSLATDLPISRPPPDVAFEGKTFVFAGAMAYGPRRACEREVEELGGRTEKGVTRRTDYVVVGSIAAADWSQAEFGDVLDEVVQYRARGVPIDVITEDHWASSLP